MQKLTAVVALMAVFSLAICFIILGAVSSDLRASLGIDEGQFGTLVLGMFLTACIVQLFIGPMVDKFGYKPIAIIGYIITGGSILMLAYAVTFNMALIAAILLGVGAMSLNTVGNTLIPVVLFEGKDPARASNFGNGFFGLGYVLTPLIFVLFMERLQLNYSVSLSILGGLMFVLLIFALIAKYPKGDTGFKFSKAISLLGKGAVLIAALALFCYISLEISMGTWIRSLMEQLYGGGNNATSNALLVLSFFGVAMMTGRFLTSAIKNLTAMGTKLISIAAFVSLAAIIGMMVSPGPVLAIVAIMAAGLAFAPIFPTVVGVTFAKFDKSLYGSIFGIIFAVGLLGGTFVPKWIGNLSVGSTVQSSLIIPAAMAGILFIISLFMGRVGAKK